MSPLQVWVEAPTMGLFKGLSTGCPCVSCYEIRKRRQRAIAELAEALFGWLAP